MKTLLASALAGLALAAAPVVDAADGFVFGAFGDTPYNRFERLHLPNLLAEMDAEPLEFVIHDGDIKNGGERCDDVLFDDRLALFQTSRNALIYVPGDNEWTDCHRASNGRFDPLERLRKLRGMFFPKAGHRALGQTALALETQADSADFPEYVENQRWQIGPVVFVAVNVTGSANNYGYGDAPSEEFLKRDAAVQAWLAESFARARANGAQGVVIAMQANPDIEDFGAGRHPRGFDRLMKQLLAETRAFAGEVLLIHGDTHLHRIDQPLKDPASGETIRNFTRLETYGSPFMGWVKVAVAPGERPLFRFQSRPYTPRRD
ncbi:MAG TPA: hypothetical protein PLN96_04690 [Zoogloea sp.]|uniref:hypothetical protein n=1 Tax=Zoogloea sp. TaxID=49181 RepID=UPI002BE6727A|nr:hypothetical protein [Zoogloea sp.]HMV17008.1 hypothetical protein [Rhodocyclaceae bacterium]HMV62295.1 hypothetical protein [Rhodocyclaceae bacterium]HMW52841.1 hypothetical protein [Rhodocyclaceae bacterium]HMY49221.1 hypothetical protein [Rhodocyclaceae bacterium]HMZ75440.1 hypothetical protein [Rhodocyclaceae bacterium]